MSALAALVKQHAGEREAQKQALEKKVELTLVIADDLENNCRAALGIELNSCVANQPQLEFAMKQLRQQVALLGKKSTAYSQQYTALVASVNELGSLEPFLRGAEGSLDRIAEQMDAITARLTGE